MEFKASFFVLLTAFLFCEVQSGEISDCAGKPADVVFVLDASNSIWKPDFQRQLDFVKDVVDFFTIGERNMMVAVITYAAYPQLQFQLNYYNRKSNIRAAIDNIRQDGGFVTRTSDALRYLRERAFLQVFGARRNVSRVAVLITDGRSDNTTLTVLEAAKVKDYGVHLFTVGVGKNLDMEELNAVASEPSQYYTFLVDNYGGLERIKDLLAIKACAVTDPPTTTTTPTTTTSPTTTTTAPTTTTRMRTFPTRRISRPIRQPSTTFTSTVTPTTTSTTTTTTTTTPTTEPSTLTSTTYTTLTDAAAAAATTTTLAKTFSTDEITRAFESGTSKRTGLLLKELIASTGKTPADDDGIEEDLVRPTIRFETQKELKVLVPPSFIRVSPKKKKVPTATLR